jgi:hypothetical protein
MCGIMPTMRRRHEVPVTEAVRRWTVRVECVADDAAALQLGSIAQNDAERDEPRPPIERAA